MYKRMNTSVKYSHPGNPMQYKAKRSDIEFVYYNLFFKDCS